MDAQGRLLGGFAGGDLLGLEMAAGPLDVPAYLTRTDIHGRGIDLELPVSIGYAIKCEPSGAEPIGYGLVGAEEGVPLLWENEVGDGRVLYLAGRPYDSISSFHRTGAFRDILRKLLPPLLSSRPFTTDIESPAEVWMNAQAAEGRVVLHFLSFDGELLGKRLSIRGDLVGEDVLHSVYPVAHGSTIEGERRGNYVTFKLPRLHRHVIMTADMERQPGALDH